jgi:predicted transcriptional regulator
MTKGVLFARPNDTILKVSEVMMHNAVSQMPVIDKDRVVGTITEETIIRNLRSNLAEEKALKVMNSPLPIVQDEMGIRAIRPMLEKYPGVLVVRGKEVVGIITRSDLLKTIT